MLEDDDAGREDGQGAPAPVDDAQSYEDLWNEAEPKDTPPSDEERGEEPEVEAEPEATEPESDDPLAGIPDDLRPRFETMRAENEKLQHRIKSDDGRQAALQRQINELRQSQKQPAQTARDPRDVLSKMQDDYPDIAGSIGELLGYMDNKIEALSQSEADRLEQQAASNFAAVESEHPDFEDVVASDSQAFKDWVDDQPRAIREKAYANADRIVDPKAAIEVIAAYKAFRNPTPAAAPEPQTSPPPPDKRRERQRIGTASPGSSASRPVASGIPAEGDYDEMWNQMVRSDPAFSRT
ncbi:MAG: hypothetical protein AAF264_00220 [Pseudomonadota bacterium]